MQRDELYAWLRLGLSPGVGNDSARQLLAAFALPQAIFEQSQTALRQVVGATKARALLDEPLELSELLKRTLDWLQQGAISGSLPRHIATLGDALYPQALLQISDPPLLLYMLGRGQLRSDAANGDQVIDSATSLAIVGSRNPTPQGLLNARCFATDLASAGLTIVSGLALGIDGAAHDGALKSASATQHRATVAVVGTGLDRVYPSAHHHLARRIAEHGLLVSEYHLGAPPRPANFPKRNRLIAALSSGTLVVEAATQSGSLITARLAAEQGKEVFAIPGSIHCSQSRGCHALIKQGAKLVETVADILEELQLPSQAAKEPNAQQPPTPDETSTPSLLSAIGFDPVTLEALQARTGLATAELQAQLMLLELDGQVARLSGGIFQRLVVA